MGVPTSRKQESENSAAGESDSGIILARRTLPFFSLLRVTICFLQPRMMGKILTNECNMVEIEKEVEWNQIVEL